MADRRWSVGLQSLIAVEYWQRRSSVKRVVNLTCSSSETLQLKMLTVMLCNEQTVRLYRGKYRLDQWRSDEGAEGGRTRPSPRAATVNRAAH